MGEYATYRGESVELGTCESFYYLREDQRHLVEGYTFDADTLGVVRFRFPFPDEDHIAPGAFGDYNRGVRIPGWTLPAEFDEHGSVQFTSAPGFLFSLPCPDKFKTADVWGREVPIGDSGATLRVGVNGYNGGAYLVAQGYRDGQLRSVVRCNACGSMWNLPVEMAEEVAACFVTEAERTEYRRDLDGWGPAHSEDTQREYKLTAARVLAGYVGRSVAA